MTAVQGPFFTADPTNTELVALAQHGSEEAIGSLYDQHCQAVFRYFQVRLDDELTAEDLTGEVFRRMLTGLPQYRAFGLPFRAWLFRIAHNLLVDHFRQASRQPTANLEHLPQQPMSEDNPGLATERKLTLAAARRALEGLDLLEREVLTLRFLSGLSVRDTALALNKSEDAIKGLQRRGLLALRFSLRDESQ